MVFTSLAVRPTSFDRLAKQLERATPSTQGASAEEAYWIRRGAYACGAPAALAGQMF